MNFAETKHRFCRSKKETVTTPASFHRENFLLATPDIHVNYIILIAAGTINRYHVAHLGVMLNACETPELITMTTCRALVRSDKLIRDRGKTTLSAGCRADRFFLEAMMYL